MGRLAFLFLALSLLLNPDFRIRARPVALWALEPVYEWRVQSQVDEVARALEATRASGGSIPSSRGLPSYLAARFHREDAALDPWGTPFFLSRDMWTVRVASAGPDRERFTADDVMSAPLRF